MASSKLKIVYLMDILLSKTDENHCIDMQGILDELQLKGIKAERKSIYDDIKCLNEYGIEIVGEKCGRDYNYHVVSRKFELAELKLLVDSVQSSRFITEKKSKELIKKIEELASEEDSKKLERQVFVADRVKTMNEKIYYNVDAIHDAIAGNKAITFQYFSWNVKKKPELRNNGSYYEVSPWSLAWDDENYYLVGYDNKEQKIKHFRVDKMLNVSKTDTRRQGRESFKEENMAIYAKKMFGMFGAKEATVTLECENYLAGVMIDRFGKDVIMRSVDDNHFQVVVTVAASLQFISWVISLGSGAKIVAPESVLKMVRDEIERLKEQY